MSAAKKKKWVLVCGAVIFLALGLLALRRDIRVARYEIDSDKVAERIRLVLISDLHSCDYGPGQAQLMEAINAQNPDIVLLCGDIVDDVMPEEKAVEFLSAVSEAYPCYYVSGNHEYRSGRIDSIKEMIAGYGITILEGETAAIAVRGQPITIAGVDDPMAGRAVFAQQLASCSGAVAGDTFALLLSHRPEYVLDYAQSNFDLVLAGHAHGGQWRIPLLLNGLFSPSQGLFPKYAGGLYDLGGTTMIVGRGLAKENVPVPRVFNRPEVVVVDIG